MLSSKEHFTLRIALVGAFLLAGSAFAQNRPVFQASKILKPAALRGVDFTVDENVPVDMDRYSFVLNTPYGRIPAQGLEMLELRIREMGALREADRMNKESPELAGIKDNIQKTGKGLGALVTDPVNTLGSIPKGIGKKAKEMTKKETYQKGGSDSRRELAVTLGCDPETRNPALSKLMDRISMRRSAGKGLMAVATFGLTGGAAIAAQGASALQTTADMQQVLKTTPLYKINENTQADLVRMGVDSTSSQQFVQHPQFTTLQRLQFIAQLRRIGGTRGLPRLVAIALRTRSEADTLGLIHNVQLLADLARDRKVAEVLDIGTPAVRLADGRIVAFASEDYLLPGPDLKSWITAINRFSPKDKEPSPAILLTTGWLSPEAKQEVAAANIQSIEAGRVDLVR